MKPRSPALQRAVADVPGIIHRLQHEPGVTFAAIAKGYGVNWTTLRVYVLAVMNPAERKAWRARARREAGKRPAGNRPQWVPIGTVRTRGGRRWIKVADVPCATGRNWVWLARWKWEALRGPIPAGMTVWFRDGNPLNDDPENIELLSKTEKLRRLVHNRPEVERRRRASVSVSATRFVKAMNEAKRVRRQIRQEHVRVVDAQPAKREPRERARENVAAFLASLEAA